MKTTVILPIYNEAENIRPIIEAVLRHLPEAHLLIVDDNSPDGSGVIADSLARERGGPIEVLHRPEKEGLGKAYLAAFRHLLKGETTQMIQMDADFSHPPELLPRLVEGLDHADFVLASRYVAGGGTQNWNWRRRALSRLGNLYARRALRLGVRDLTGGYKAYNRRVVEFLAGLPLDAAGYYFQIETTARALSQGFTCREIPFLFTERREGQSKMSRRIIGEAFYKTLRLRRSLSL